MTYGSAGCSDKADTHRRRGSAQAYDTCQAVPHMLMQRAMPPAVSANVHDLPNLEDAKRNGKVIGVMCVPKVQQQI